MNKKNLISLIIPTYNCEKFLPALFTSIDNQSNKLYEVIIIDDKSNDNSAKLIRDYARSKKNVKTLFLSKNKGVSNARNAGVRLVKGNYLWFIDSDDQLNNNAIEKFHSEIKKDSKIDVFVFGYNYLEGPGKSAINRIFQQFDPEKSYSGSDVFYQFNPAPWNKLFKTAYWKKQEFMFPPGISIAQDVSIIYYAIFKATKVKILHSCLYDYSFNESSSVNSFKTRKITDIFAANQQLLNNFFKTAKTINELLKLRVSEITFHSIDYFYARFKSSFLKKDHTLFLKLLNTFLSINTIDITSLLSWKIGSKTLIEVDEGIISNRIKGSINVPFSSIKLSKQIQEIEKSRIAQEQTVQDLLKEISNKNYLLQNAVKNYEINVSLSNELEKRVSDYTTSDAKKNDLINKLSEEKQQLFEKINSLEKFHLQKEQIINSLQSQNKEYQLSVNQLRLEIDKVNKRIDSKEKEVNDLQNKLVSIEDQNRGYKHSVDELNLEINKLNQKSDFTKQQIIESDLEITRLNQQIYTKGQTINHLQNKLVSSENENENFKQQVRKLDLQLAKLHEAIDWYKRTYQDRNLTGIIKDRVIKMFPFFNLRNYKSQWKSLTKIFRKNKLKKATVKSTASTKIVCAIVNYNLNENSLKLKNSFSKFFDTIVFDSGSKVKNKEFVLLDNVYYSGLFNHAYQFAIENNYEYLLYVCSDVEVQDDQIEIMVNNLNKIDLDKIGVYSPSSTGRSHLYCKNNNNNTGLRTVPFVEGFMFMAHLDVLKSIAPIDLNINKYGWGLDVAKGYFARKLNKLCILDDSVTVHHPEGTGYSDVFAEAGMWEWMETFQDENFKKFYTKQIDIIRRNQAGLNKVSIIIPCYNQASYMGETIHSLLLQDHGNMEIIILNDGSTDNTEEVALRYSKQFNNIKYIFKQNGGLGQTRNEGLKHATGDFIQFLDSDDLLSSTKISDQVYSFILDPDIQVSYTEYLCFEDGTPEKTWTYSRLILKEDPVLDLIQNWETELSIPIHCFLFRKSLLETLFFDEELPNHEDWEFHLKIAAKNPIYRYEPNGIAYYRVRNTSMSRDRELMIKGKKMCIQKAIDSNKFSDLYLHELYKRLE